MSRAIIIVLCAVLSSCQLWRVDGMMDTAERQMGCAVDSALTTMRAIKRYAVLTPERRARYGLLYSVALDKNYIDVASDSLIRYSAEYYDRKGTPHQRLKAYYYLGRTQENAKQYDKAILSYLDAAQYADNVDDKYLLALLYSQMGEMYGNHFNYEKGYEYTEKAYNYFKELDSKYQVLMLYRMGQYSGYKPYYKRAIELFNRALEDAERYNYHDVDLSCCKYLLSSYICVLDFVNAEKLLKILEEKYDKSWVYYNCLDYALAAVVYAYSGNERQSKQLLDTSWKLARNKQDSISIKHYYSYCLHYWGDKNRAKGFMAFGEAVTELSEILMQHIANPIDAGQQKYFEQKYAHQKQRDREKKIIYIVLLSVVIAIISALFIYSRRCSKREMENYNAKIAYYTDILESLKQSNKGDVYPVLDEILNGKFGVLDQLCQTYYENANNSKKQLAVYKRVEELITEIYAEKESLVTIENAVNRSRNNILEDAKVEISSLSDDEYKLMCYMYAGFSTQAICLFFKCSSEALYSRVYRLKKKIKASNSSKAELFIKHLG